MDASILISMGAIFVLICMSGFFSGSETALTAVSRAKMHALELDGKKRAGTVNRILDQKEKMIGALLLGNNLVNILASALATSMFIKLFGEAGVVYATLIMTMLVLVFAEVMPKTYAIHFSDKMAMAIAPIIRLVIVVFSPITQMVSYLVGIILNMFGARISESGMEGGSEELRGAIELHDPDGENYEQRAMLRSILDLVDVDVEEIMTHRKNVVMIDADLPADKIVEEVLDSPYTRLPVYQGEQDNIVGVIHVKALLKEMQAHNGKLTKVKVTDIASDPWFVPESNTLDEQLQAFRQRREHFAIVVDEYGSFMGVVTLEDVLEEIVGEIEDETDEIVSGVRRQGNGTYLVEGDVTIRDLNREFDWNLPYEEYSTVAGLILHESKTIPEAGQSFTFYDLRFDVVRRLRNQITMVRISLMPTKEQDDTA